MSQNYIVIDTDLSQGDDGNMNKTKWIRTGFVVAIAFTGVVAGAVAFRGPAVTGASSPHEISVPTDGEVAAVETESPEVTPAPEATVAPTATPRVVQNVTSYSTTLAPPVVPGNPGPSATPAPQPMAFREDTKADCSTGARSSVISVFYSDGHIEHPASRPVGLYERMGSNTVCAGQ